MGRSNSCRVPDTDVEQMYFVAKCRGVSEYRLFEDAFHGWSHGEFDQPALEQAFARYLRVGEVPGCVRHYLRRYLKEHQSELVAHTKELALARLVERLLLALIVLMVILALTW